MGQKDIVEKILGAHNDVCADVVNGLLFEGKKVIDENDLQEQAPRSYYKAEGKIRELERDVVKLWKNRSNFQLACIGFENQTATDADMALRVIGYGGAEYQAQRLNIKRTKDVTPSLL